MKIDIGGATVEVDARLIQMRHDDTWSIVLQRLRDARDAAIDAAIDAARDVGLPERIRIHLSRSLLPIQEAGSVLQPSITL